ncbi:hypothetical protein C7E12_21805, partial [Stenotrophomonas maltophilia]
LWPNMLFGCRDRGVPVYILNARLSARSLRGYRLPRPFPAQPGADPGNRVVAEHAVRLP